MAYNILKLLKYYEMEKEYLAKKQDFSNLLTYLIYCDWC